LLKNKNTVSFEREAILLIEAVQRLSWVLHVWRFPDSFFLNC